MGPQTAERPGVSIVVFYTASRMGGSSPKAVCAPACCDNGKAAQEMKFGSPRLDETVSGQQKQSDIIQQQRVTDKAVQPGSSPPGLCGKWKRENDDLAMDLQLDDSGRI